MKNFSFTILFTFFFNMLITQHKNSTFEHKKNQSCFVILIISEQSNVKSNTFTN